MFRFCQFLLLLLAVYSLMLSKAQSFSVHFFSLEKQINKGMNLEVNGVVDEIAT
jgi:hypothetical protein